MPHDNHVNTVLSSVKLYFCQRKLPMYTYKLLLSNENFIFRIGTRKEKLLITNQCYFRAHIT